MKKIIYVIFIFILLGITLAFSNWNNEKLSVITFNNVNVNTETCISPYNIQILNLSTNSVDISWEDNKNNLWEYFIEEAWVTGGSFPVGSGTLSNTKKVTITNTNGTAPVALQSETEYEFYVRAVCGNGYNSEWIGPFSFKTPCDIFVVPYQEGFNTSSTTRECWKRFTLDNHHTTEDPFVYLHTQEAVYEGDTSLAYRESYSERSALHDEWLVSPSILLEDTKIYKMSYKAFEVHDGIKYNVSILQGGYSNIWDLENISEIKQIEIPDGSNIEKIGWIERSVVIQGVDGAINFVWNFKQHGRTLFYFDDFLIEEIADCSMPWGLGVKDVSENNATILWEDQINTEWEYWVQSINEGTPTSAGSKTSLKENLITTDYKGDTLKHTNEYEFYVRSICKTGEYSSWIGPFNFGTACGVFDIPFFEDFRAWVYTSGFIRPQCWAQIDSTGSIHDIPFQYTRYPEDDRWRFAGNNLNIDGYSAIFPDFTNGFKIDGTINDWLISPTIRFEANKVYRLKYQYKTKSIYENKFEVLLSNSGKDKADFNKVLVPLKTYSNETAQEKVCFIENVYGEVNIAWHLLGAGPMAIGIDNVSIEEVVGCAEPLQIEINNIEFNEVTVSWADDFGADTWEYYVQESGGGMPISNGINTKNKKNTVIKDVSGKPLESNTEYEFYVRTDCGNGEYSIWQGPFQFTTTCDVYTTTFWEGFNSDSTTMNCWTIVDGNLDANMWQNDNVTSYEGDGAISFGSFDFTGLVLNDDWLISPTIYLDGGSYVLKYRYVTTGSAFGLPINNSFEVLLSSNGIKSTDFSDILKPSKVYLENLWKEEVLFFDAVKGEVNIAWHIISSGFSAIYIDDVSLEKVITCPEPYYIEITQQNSTSVDVEWKQYGDETEWEVIMVEHGEKETAIPIFTTSVTGTPKTTITGLNLGEAYSVYVRAKCADNTYSNWSSPLDVYMDVTNIDCDSALELLVNQGVNCNETEKATFIGAQFLLPSPSCSTLWGEKDIWFKFTALAPTHILKIQEIVGGDPFLSSLGASFVYGALYDQNCSTPGGSVLECFEFMTNSKSFSRTFSNLQTGYTYYIRISVAAQDISLRFNICLTSPALKVSESGEEYTVEELVKEVLIDADCDLVKNIRYQAGDGNNRLNTLGYFNKPLGVDFPFEKGLVLASHSLKDVSGPYNASFPKQQIPKWSGDDDLKEIIDEVMRRMGGERYRNGRDTEMAMIEFDFIPLKDSIRLEYLFASDSYVNSMLCKTTNSFFVAQLTDLKTKEKKNIALISETNDPVSVATIKDMEKIGPTPHCISKNPEYFWKHFDINDDPFDAPINYLGMTIPMTTGFVSVVPGRAYKMTLIITDFCKDECTNGSGSAVFINAKSLQLGWMDELLLGENLLIATNTAICPDESAVIQSGITTSDELYMEIEWYKDGVLISGANDPDLEVDEAGEYEIKVKFPDLKCESSDSIVVEVYPAISETVHQAETLSVCQYSLQETVVNLTMVETTMFKNVDRSMYTTSYYNTTEDANTAENAISDVKNYSLDKEPQAQTLYIRVENTKTGCHEVFELHIQSEEGSVPDKPSDVTVCAEYVFPQVNEKQYYYMQPGGEGKAYKMGDVLAEPGEHTIYLLQINNEEGCYEEIAYKVKITAPVEADVFEDKTLSCEYYELKPLSEYNHYFTEPGGNGDELYPGRQILEKQTIYVYASSEGGLCTDESSFTIDYEDCPIPRGISPNNDGLNDAFDLTPHGVENIKIYNRWGTEVYSHGAGYTTQWHGQSKNGKQLPDGTYYYVIQAHGKTRTGWVQINK